MLLNQLCRSDDLFKTVLWDLTTKHTLPANVAHELARSSKLRGNRESVLRRPEPKWTPVGIANFNKCISGSTWRWLSVTLCYKAWTPENLLKLLNAMKTNISDGDRMRAFLHGVKKLDWDKVAFPPFSPKDCQEKWRVVAHKVRRIFAFEFNSWCLFLRVHGIFSDAQDSNTRRACWWSCRWTFK